MRSSILSIVIVSLLCACVGTVAPGGDELRRSRRDGGSRPRGESDAGTPVDAAPTGSDAGATALTDATAARDSGPPPVLDGGSTPAVDGGTVGPIAGEDPPIVCTGQCVYVRAGAAGTGADWASALPRLPETLVRGRIYFVATGTYPSYRFDDPARGTDTITIRRATARDHGTDAGWVSSYGEGQVVWNGPLYFDTDHWVLDGAVRDELDWLDGGAYGFRIFHDGRQQQIRIGSLGVAVSHVTIRRTYLEASAAPLPTSSTERIYGLDIDTFGGSGTSFGLVVDRCLFRYGNVPIFTHDNDGMIVERSAFDDNQSNGANHGEAMSAFYSNHRFVIRHNLFRRIRGTAVIAFTTGSSVPVDGFEIYGNVVWEPSVGDGVFGFDRVEWPFSRTRIYNNTIVDKAGGYNTGIAIRSGTDNVVWNNLWVNCASSFWNGAGATYRDNAYSWDRSEPGVQTGVPTSIFTDYAGDDFTLAAPTATGSTLSAPYASDLLGQARGADGTWDRGAYEHASR
jgi:hypothetical protein